MSVDSWWAEIRRKGLVDDLAAVRVGEVGGRREIAQVAGDRRRQSDLVGDDELGELVLPHRHARRRVHAEHAGVLECMPQPARQLRPLRQHEAERVRIVANRIEPRLVCVRHGRSPQEGGAHVVGRDRARIGVRNIEREGDTDPSVLEGRCIDGQDVGATARECSFEDDDRWIFSMPGHDQDHWPLLSSTREEPAGPDEDSHPRGVDATSGVPGGLREACRRHARRRHASATGRSGRRRRTRSPWSLSRHD